jgi:hypothetical protein
LKGKYFTNSLSNFIHQYLNQFLLILAILRKKSRLKLFKYYY